MSQKRRSVADEPFLLVRTLSADHRDGTTTGTHTHDWHQLVYVRAGLMAVSTVAGSWLAPPTWAVWVPAATGHTIRFVGASSLRTCYLRPDGRGEPPGGCRALAVSPLLRELIVRTTDLGMLDGRDPTEAAIATLIAAELGGPGPPPFTLPEPTTPATLRATRLIEADPTVGTPALATAVGLGTRTLERRFLTETGLTLGRWRQQRMLLRGLEQIAAGASVTTAATAAGYATASAYVAAFKKTFGTTPARWF